MNDNELTDKALLDDELLLNNEDDDAGEEAGGLYEHYRVVADKGQQLLRVDKFLLVHLKDTSRNRIQAAAKAGLFTSTINPSRATIASSPTMW